MQADLEQYLFNLSYLELFKSGQYVSAGLELPLHVSSGKWSNSFSMDWHKLESHLFEFQAFNQSALGIHEVS